MGQIIIYIKSMGHWYIVLMYYLRNSLDLIGLKQRFTQIAIITIFKI